jgi:hypothetical protein
MTTKREQILVAAKTVLDAIKTGQPGLGIKNVDRSRADKYSGTEAPSINLTADTEAPTENGTGPVDARLEIEVGVYHRGTQPDTLADPIVEAVHAALMSSNFGGLVLDITEGATSWDFDEADRTALMVRQRFTLWYRRATRTSLTS